MSTTKRQVKTQVDANLLTRLQTAVSGASAAPSVEVPAEPSNMDANAHSDGEQSRGQGTPRVSDSRPSWRNLVPRKRAQRTTLSMPVEVGSRARRLAMALTLFEERDVSLGTALSQALDLLEGELRRRGARIPEQDIPLRSGSRHL